MPSLSRITNPASARELCCAIRGCIQSPSLAVYHQFRDGDIKWVCVDHRHSLTVYVAVKFRRPAMFLSMCPPVELRIGSRIGLTNPLKFGILEQNRKPEER